MKTKVIFLVSMLASAIAASQERELKEMEITPPAFEGEFRLNIAEFLGQNFVYPLQSARRRDQGNEVVEFTVTPEGNLADFTIINSVSPEIDREIIRVLKFTSGKWSPGKLKGVPVEMRHEVSMMFKIDPSVNFTEKAKTYLKKGNEHLFVKNNPQKALKYLDQGICYLPNDEALLAMRSLCKYKLGDEKGAARDWDRIKVLVQRNGKTVKESIYALEKDEEIWQEFTSRMNVIKK